MDKRDHLNEEELAFYVDCLRLRRTERLSTDMRDHVESCMECKEAIMDVSSLVPDEVYAEERESRRYLTVRSSRLLWRLAAGIVLLLGGASIIYFLSLHKPEEGVQPSMANISVTDTAKGTDSSSSHEHNRSFLAREDRFEQLPTLERLANGKFRSLALGGVTPANGDTISAQEEQVFSWGSQQHDESCELVIVTNRGREILRAPVSGQRYRLTRKLADGLYYWKLEQAGELVLVRKFFVMEAKTGATSR